MNGSDWDAGHRRGQGVDEDATAARSQVIGFDSELPEFLPLWAKANGADLISEDGRTARLDDPAVVEALEYAVGIYDEQGGFSAVKASVTRRTSSARATSSQARRSGRCRWSIGTSTCSTRPRPTRRWPSTPSATGRASPRLGVGQRLGHPEGEPRSRRGLPRSPGP